MNIVNREHIDIGRWDALVDRGEDSSFFSYSWYLDAVAENWCVLVNEDYTKGLALPFTVRAGVEVLYSPIFSRYAELLGKGHDLEETRSAVFDRFKVFDFASKQAVFKDSLGRFFQVIRPEDEWKIGSQAKRSLKKADKSELTIQISDDFDPVYHSIHEELNEKFSGVTEKTLLSLHQLLSSAKANGKLKVFTVVKGGEIKGGICCLVKNNQLLYLKGAVDEETKKCGGMYLAIHEAIQCARAQQSLFDFGGSNIEGVRKFNNNLGGMDQSYAVFAANNGPVWFKLAKKVKTLIGR